MIDLIFYDGNEQEIPSLTQWDLGRVLYIRNTENLVQTPVFHFYNRSVDESTPVLSEFVTINSHSYIKVDVPNEILQKSLAIHVHMGVANNANELETIGTGVITVIQKAKPSYYEYVQNIADIFDETISRKLEEELEGGSPKGVFATKSDLTNENSGLYVCMTANDDTSATPPIKSGYLYYWDKETDTLNYLGIQYQAPVLADGSVTTDKIHDGDITDDKLANPKWNYVSLGTNNNDSVFNDNTTNGTIYQVMHQGVCSVFFTIDGTTGKTQVKYQDNKWEYRNYDNSNSSWGGWSITIPNGAITEDMLSTALKKLVIEDLRKFESTADLTIYMESEDAEAGQLVRVKETVNGEDIYQVYILQNGTNNTLIKKKINSNEEALRALEDIVSALSEDLNDLEDDNATAHEDIINRFNNNAAGSIAFDELTKTIQLMSVGDGTTGTEGSSKALGRPIKISGGIDGLSLGKDVDEVNNKVYLTISDTTGKELSRVEIPAGSGSSGSIVVMKVRSLMPSSSFTVPYDDVNGCSCTIAYTFSSEYSDDHTSTGNGTAYYYVNGDLVLVSQNLAQGRVSVDLGEYLAPNTNNDIRVTVVDSEGNRKTLGFTVVVAYNYITSKFAKTSIQRSDFSIPIVPVGAGTKRVYCKIDDEEPTYKDIGIISNSTIHFDINGLTHGGHTIEIYMRTYLDGYAEAVYSNTLTFGVTYIDSESDDKLLVARTEESSVKQYSNASVYFVVSDKDYAKCNIDIEVKHSADNETFETVYNGSLNVDVDTVEDWSYRVMEDGYYQIILSYAVIDPTTHEPVVDSQTGDPVVLTQTVEYEVEALDVAQATTSGLQFLFDPVNRSNNEPASTKDKYSYTNSSGNTYNVQFSNIDFKTFGWTGSSLNIPIGGRVNIPFQPFATDVDTTRGKTIEMVFKVKNVYDYGRNIISCHADDKGIEITPNKGILHKNALDYLDVSYNDETEIHLSFVITNRDESDYSNQNDEGVVEKNRGQLIYIFINSDISGVMKYDELDEFDQSPPAGITIGSDYAEIELYKVRCYNIALFEIAADGSSRSYNVLNNYIADTPNVDDMIARNARNNVFDTNKMIDPTKLPDNCPYMVIESTDLPQYKGDNKTVSGYFVDKADSSNSFIFVNADLNVQGTSSEGYYVKNFKIKFKNGDQNVLRQEINVGTKIIDGVEYLKLTDVKSAKLKIAILKTIDSVEYIKVSELQENNLSITAEEPVYVTYDEESYVRAVDTDIYVTSESERYIKSTFTDIIVVDGNQYRPFSKYGIYSNSVPVKSFCLKADVASSEGANNIILMKIWDDITRWLDTYNDYDMLTPPQKEDARVRQCIDGRPMVLYWKNASTNFVKFWGKYNFNNDKGTEDTFGFDLDKYPNCEAWDFRDNGLVVTEFKSGDFDNIITYTYKSGSKKGQSVTDRCCKIAFEPIFPDYDEPYDDYTQLHRVVAWVASTNPDNARPNVNLGSNYTFNLTTPVVSVDINGTATDCILHPINPSFGESDNLTDIANLVEISNNAEVVEKNQEETIDGNTVTKLIRYIKLSDTNITSHTGDNCTLTYTKDTVQYRLAKFKNEFEDYFAKNLAILYYIWTDIFLMVDSRAKNQHMVTFDGQHWYFFPYDGDTALGIDNIGALIFDYWLEDDSTYNGSNVYNGQDSVLWNNVKKVFKSEITTMIDRLVSKGFTYEYVKNRFNNHQAAWSEAVFCADTEVKYIVPWFETGTKAYLAMAQGSKSSQRDYWLKHRFSYYLSKYMTGTAIDSRNEIQMRMTTPTGVSTSYREVENPSGNPSQSYYYEKDGNNYVASSDTEVDSNKTYYVDNKTIVVTPFSNTYVIAEFGSTRQKKYCNANESVSFQSTLDSSGDSMLNIFNGAEVKNFGDLSAAYIKRFELGTMATNLESVIVGSEEQGYVNEGLVANMFSLGNSRKLKTVNVSNCVNLRGSIDVSNCYNIRTVLAKGSKITSVNLPDGSQIETLKLPNTITNLTLHNQVNLSTFEMEGYSYLKTLDIQNTPIDVLDIVQNATGLTKINLVDINWTFEDTELLDTLVRKNNSDSCTVQLTGRVYVPELTSKQLRNYQNAWGNGLLIDSDRLIVQYPVTFKNYDGTVLKNDDNESAILYVNEGETPYDAIVIDANGDYYTKDELGNADELLFRKPTKPYAWNETYAFDSWDNNLSSRIREAVDYTAQYTTTARQYEVQFKFTVAGQAVQTTTVTAGDTVTYDSSNGQPSKASDGNNWYLCRGWTDTGQEYIISTTDESRIYGLFATITLNEALLADFAATVPTVLKPTLVFNTIYNECSLPTNGIPRNPTKTDIKNYLANYRYAYTNDPELQEQSAYTLGELYAICMSEKYSLYLPLGSRARIVCDTDTYIGGDTAGDGKGKFEIEVMGYNVYERADSGFAGVGDCGGATNAMTSGDYQGQKIKGMISSPTAMSELSGKSAGLYICNTQGYQCDTDGFVCDTSTGNLYDSDGCVYYYNGETSPTKVGAYFSHVVWSWVFSDSTGAGGQYMDTTYCMNNTAPNPHTINGWGNDEAEDYKKCVMNNWLNGTVFGYLPSELQGVITPVKVVSGRGRASASDNTFKITPVSSVSRLFLLSAGEVFGRNDTPYVNEISKWSSLAVRNANDEISSISRYWRLTSNNVKLKHPYYGTGSSGYYWLRSPYSTSNFVYVYGNGNFNGNYAYITFGVSPAFCIG